ncbi:hypothetical protein AB0L06_30655 [Spirillospora sp. NPDC052269]
MNRPPAGPLDGAARTRPAGWLPHPLTTDPAAATEQAHDLLTRHHPTAAVGPLRCLTARYRSATFAVGAPPALILKRHADFTAYLGEVLAYQLLDGQALVPELREANDDTLTLLTEYLPHTVALTHACEWDELIGVVAGIHTTSAYWDRATSDAASGWTVRALLEAPVPDWITHPGQWQRALEVVAGAHGDQHVPLGCLDLKSDHARRDTTGRLKILDVETLRPDLTGLWDLITPRPPRQHPRRQPPAAHRASHLLRAHQPARSPMDRHRARRRAPGVRGRGRSALPARRSRLRHRRNLAA